MYVCIHDIDIYIYIYTYIHIYIYISCILSNAICLTRPRSFHASFVVSGALIPCYITCHL